MYTISQAAARTGVSVEVLRAWERRYGVVAPERTESGYRLYGEAAITRIRAMRRLVDEGWSASVAAQQLRTLDDEAIRALAEPLAVGQAPVAGADASDLADRFVHAAADVDGGRIETVLDEMSAQGTFEQVAGSYLLPALEALGDAWADGRVSVAGEHAASHGALRRLSGALEAAGRQPGPKDRPVLVGLPPGARHELGALAFAVAVRRAGLPVLYLGPDLPVDDWLRAARATRARAAILGLVTAADVGPARQVAATIGEELPETVIAVGGRAVPAEDRNGWLVLPDDLLEAVGALEAALGRQRGARSRAPTADATRRSRPRSARSPAG